jgi:putative inorganic carbon (HCO3(-)) transporter
MIFSSSIAILRSQFISLPRGCVVSLSVFIAFTLNFIVASGHDLQRCVEVVALCIAAFVLIARTAKNQVPFLPTSASALLLAFFLFGAVAVATANSLRHAVYEWCSILLLIVMIFAIANELAQNARRSATLLKWIGLVCGLYSLRLIFMYALALAAGYQVDMHKLVIGFSNARFLNHTQTALLPLIVLLVLQTSRTSKLRMAWFALASFWWALLFVCEARASILGLALGCVVTFAIRRANARAFMVTMAWTASVGMLIYALLFLYLPTLVGLLPVSTPLVVLERTASNPSSSRNLLWGLALQFIAAHPWFGIGPLHFAHYGSQIYTGAHPHDWMLQIAVEWGVPALLCLLGVIFIGIRALVRSSVRIANGDISNQHVLVALLVACSAIFVDGMLSGSIVMPQSQLALVLMLGIAYAWVRGLDNVGKPDCGTCPTAVRIVFAFVVSAGLCGLIWSMAPDFIPHVRDDALTPSELAANPGMHWPRMWEAGYF